MILGRAVPTTVWSSAARKIADHHRAEDAHPDGMRQLDRRAIGDAVCRLCWGCGHHRLPSCDATIVRGRLGQFRS